MMLSTNYEMLEMLMLICFGSSWPFAIFRWLRSKSVCGKSVIFLVLILIGYAFGIALKLKQQPNAVIWLYVLNSAMISTEIVLYFRYRKRTDGGVTNKAQQCLCPPACFYAS